MYIIFGYVVCFLSSEKTDQSEIDSLAPSELRAVASDDLFVETVHRNTFVQSLFIIKIVMHEKPELCVKHNYAFPFVSNVSP